MKYTFLTKSTCGPSMTCWKNFYSHNWLFDTSKPSITEIQAQEPKLTFLIKSTCIPRNIPGSWILLYKLFQGPTTLCKFSENRCVDAQPHIRKFVRAKKRFSMVLLKNGLIEGSALSKWTTKVYQCSLP